MTAEHETPALLRDTSDLQRRINGLSQFEQLEKDGIHAHVIMEVFDPTPDHSIAAKVHELRIHGKPAVKPL